MASAESLAARSKKPTRRRANRATSNVFSLFSQSQIQEFKEAFNIIDQNRDGFIDRDDLCEMLISLGKPVLDSDGILDIMLADAPGPLNFTMFLTMFGERMGGTDPENVIHNAFGIFDETNSGYVNEEKLRNALTTMGDRWSHEQVDELLSGAPIEPINGLKYAEFVRTLKHGAGNDDQPLELDMAKAIKKAQQAEAPPKQKKTESVLEPPPKKGGTSIKPSEKTNNAPAIHPPTASQSPGVLKGVTAKPPPAQKPPVPSLKKPAATPGKKWPP